MNAEQAAPGVRKSRLHVAAGLFTGVFVLVVYGLKTLDVWNEHFDKPGPVYMLYHALRLTFLIYFAWMLYFCGKMVLERAIRAEGGPKIQVLDAFLLSSFVGASLFVALALLMGLLRMYTLGLALGLTAPIVFVSYSRFVIAATSVVEHLRRWGSLVPKARSTPFGWATAALLIGILLQAVHLIVSKGLLPDLLTNDTVGHYLPYYERVLRDHGIGRNPYYLHFYYSKGHALFFLAALLSDVQTVQLVSVYFLFLSAIVLYRVVGRTMQGAAPWSLLAVLLYITIYVPLFDRPVITEFQKGHVVIGSFLLFLCYLTVLARDLPRELLGRWGILQSSIAVVMIVISPVSTAFVMPYLLLQAVYFGRGRWRASAAPLGAAGVTFLVMLALNYEISGLAECTPFPVWLRVGNLSRLASWVSPLALRFQLGLNTADGTGAGAIVAGHFLSGDRLINALGRALYDGWLMPKSGYVVLLGLAGLSLGLAVRKKSLRGGVAAGLLPFGFLQAITFLLMVVTAQQSIHRYASFRIFTVVLLYVGALRLTVELATQERVRSRLIVAALFGLGLYSVLTTAWRTQLVPMREKLEFLAGTKCYAHLYNGRWGAIQCGLDAQAAARGQKIVLLNFLPGLYGMPGNLFQRPFMCDFNRSGDFEPAMFGTPEEAAEAFKRNRLNYFMVLRGEPLLCLGYTPLFEPENMKKFFRKVEGTEPRVLLLTWRSGDERGLDEGQLFDYQRTREANQMHPYAVTYRRIRSERIEQTPFPHP